MAVYMVAMLSVLVLAGSMFSRPEVREVLLLEFVEGKRLGVCVAFSGFLCELDLDLRDFDLYLNCGGFGLCGERHKVFGGERSVVRKCSGGWDDG